MLNTVDSVVSRRFVSLNIRDGVGVRGDNKGIWTGDECVVKSLICSSVIFKP